LTHICSRKNLAKFHPDPISSSEVLGFFQEVATTIKKTTTTIRHVATGDKYLDPKTGILIKRN